VRLRDTVGAFARSLGYTSEYAFNRAFTQARRIPPDRYRTQSRVELKQSRRTTADRTAQPVSSSGGGQLAAEEADLRGVGDNVDGLDLLSPHAQHYQCGEGAAVETEEGGLPADGVGD
jgi:hypothetical protein